MFAYTLLFSAVCLASTLAQVAPGQNAYLPPVTGYPSGPSGQSRPSFPSGPSGGGYPSAPSGGGYPSGPAGGGDHQHVPGMPFDFSYAVQDAESGNDYSHNAVSDGDVTRGEYRVQLPDGRLQIVKYTADWKNGFNSEVTYEGEAKFPDPPAGGYPGANQGAGSAPGGGYRY